MKESAAEAERDEHKRDQLTMLHSEAARKGASEAPFLT